jgi:phosphoesterase RecJ-like protein
MIQVYEKTVDLLRKSRSILVASHIDPDGDAVGSELALQSVLKRLGKTVRVLAEDGVPASYAFLEGAGEVSTSPGEPCDVAVVVDSGTLERTGWVADVVRRCPVIVNIDHHKSNDNFGNINLVETSAAAAGEIVYKLLRALGVELTKGEAEALYVAMMTDSGCFRFPCTTSETLRIAAHLMEIGVAPYHVSSEIYWRKSLASVKILGSALSSIEVTPDGKIATMDVTRDMYRSSGATSSDTEGFANYPRSIDGVAVGVLLREADDGLVRVSLRAAEGYDVDEVAKAFGGGGHSTAAGFRIQGDVPSVKDEVRRGIISHLKKRQSPEGC